MKQRFSPYVMMFGAYTFVHGAPPYDTLEPPPEGIRPQPMASDSLLQSPHPSLSVSSISPEEDLLSWKKDAPPKREGSLKQRIGHFIFQSPAMNELDQTYVQKVEEILSPRAPTTPESTETTWRIADDQPIPLVHAVIDGGGVRGLGAATQMMLFEEEASFSLSDALNNVGGTSIGSVLAAGIAGPKFKAKNLQELILSNAKKIFPHSYLRPIFTLGGLIAPRYDRSALDHLLKHNLGGYHIKDLSMLLTIPTISQRMDAKGVYGRPSTLYFTTAGAWSGNAPNVDLYTATASSSAAPGYFKSPVFEIEGETHRMMDGGLTVNAPGFETLLQAEEVYGPLTKDDIVIEWHMGEKTEETNKGPGFLSRFNPFLRGGLFENAGAIFDAFLDAQTQRSHHNLDRFLRSKGIPQANNLDYNFQMSSLDLDNTSDDYLNELQEQAQIGYMERRQETDALIEKIRPLVEDKDNRQDRLEVLKRKQSEKRKRL